MREVKRWGVILLLAALWLGNEVVGMGQNTPPQLAALEEATRLNNRAFELYKAGRYDEAIPLAEYALAIYEKTFGPENAYVATALNNLAALHKAKSNYTRAEPLYQRALAMYEKEFGPEHPDVANALNNLAQLYGAKGDYARAEPLYQRALAIREKTLGKEHPSLANMLNNLAALYDEKGDSARAEPLYQRALAIGEKSLGPDHPHVATALNNLAMLYAAKGNFARAEPLYQRALTIKEKSFGPGHPQFALSLNNLAMMYQAKGDYVQAEPLLQQALAIREKALATGHPDVATSLNNLALLYRAKGEYARAEPLYQRALAIVEKAFGREHLNVTATLSNLALLYQEKGEYAQAEPLYQRALAINEKSLGPERPQVALALSNLAVLYGAKGEYARAEPLLQRALAINEKALGLEHPQVALSLNNFATLYQARGDFARAEPLYQRALAISEKSLGPEHPQVAVSLNNLAQLYGAKGDYVRTEPLLKRVLAINEKTLGLEHPQVALSLNNLATLYQAKSDYVLAEPLYQRALLISEKSLGPGHPQVALLLTNLAAVYKVKGDYGQAESLLKRALAINEKALGPEHHQVALMLNNLAQLYGAMGEPARSEPLLKRALAINEKALGPKHPDVAFVLSNLAMWHAAREDIRQMVDLLSRENDIREHNLALILTTGSERQKQLYLNALSGQADGTVSLHVRSAPKDARLAQLALTIILQRKGRALDAMSDQIAWLRRRATPHDQALLGQLADTRSQLATLQISGGGKLPLEARRLRIGQLETEAERLEAEIGKRSAEFLTITQPITLAAVRNAIPEGVALVEFFVYQPLNVKAKSEAEKFGTAQYVAYVLRRETEMPLWVELGEAISIDTTVAGWRAALRDPKRTDVKALARTVDERVMRPIRKLLGPTRQILLSPDGALNLIPFDALVDENGKYLVEDYTISYLTSGRDLLRLQVARESQAAPLVIANPLFDLNERSRPRVVAGNQTNIQVKQGTENRLSRDFDFATRNYKPLPGTAAEAETLGRLLPDATVLTGERATETALKNIIHPRLLHIATHGFFFADGPQSMPKIRGEFELAFSRETIDFLPNSVARLENPLLRSGLILAGVRQKSSGAGEDGVLTALEVAGLDLWGTKLVVLSACETGLGEVTNGIGVYGLRRAMVLAGSETQVMSLWKVPDAGTRDLMAAYYTRLQAGEGRTAALRQVQLEMLRGQMLPEASAASGQQAGRRETVDILKESAPQDYRHPYYWASFISSGDWRGISGK